MRTLMIIGLALALGGCVSTVETSEPSVDSDAPAASAPIDHCNAALQAIADEHPDEVCSATAECTERGIGDTCICGLCVRHR